MAACLLLTPHVIAHAQGAASPEPREGVAARSGNDWIDRRLLDIDTYAQRYPAAFVDELVRYFDAPRALVEQRLAAKRAKPGDVYYACAIAQMAGKPCRGVLVAWERNSGAGWTTVAEQLDIIIGTEQSTRLRQSIERSYRHWSRPQPGSVVGAVGDGSGSGGS